MKLSGPAWRLLRVALKEHQEFSQKLKTRSTYAERVLRPHLLPLGFKEQVGLGPWIADFFHKDSGVVIEVDGGIHDTARCMVKDDAKESDLAAAGILVLRWRNEEVIRQPEKIAALVNSAISGRFVDLSAAKFVLMERFARRRGLLKDIRNSLHAAHARSVEAKRDNHGSFAVHPGDTLGCDSSPER